MARDPVRVLLFENFDNVALPTSMPLKASLPHSLGFESTQVWIELVDDPKECFGGSGRSLKATYPSISRDEALYPWSGFDLRPYNTDHVYIRFRARMTKARHGLKFVKVFGQREEDNYANTTFGLDYTGVESGFGSLYCVSYGDGSEIANDTANVILLGGGGNIGRAESLPGLSVETPQHKAFSSSDWSTSWHRFEFYVKFNSGKSAGTEKNDGEVAVKIDDKVYVEAKGLYNRHYSNKLIDRIEILGWTQTARGVRTPEFEVWYDDIEISLNGWLDRSGGH